MITKIIELKNIGKFANFQQTQDFCTKTKANTQNCNIVFGFNGSGKSTISNVLSLFGAESFTKNKTEILKHITRNDTEQTSIKIQLQGLLKPTIYDPTNNLQSFYVFNSNFVSDHVSNGVRKFSGSTDSLTTPELQDINTKIKELEDNRKTATKQIELFNTEFGKIRERAGKDFGSKVSNSRLTNLTIDNVALPQQTEIELEDRKSSLVKEYSLSTKSEEINNHITQIQNISLQKIGLNSQEINTLLSKTIQQLSKDVLERRIRSVKDGFADEQYKQSTEEWFRFGKRVLEQQRSHCPLCNSDISGQLNSILKDFNGYFDKAYDEFITALSQQKSNIETIIGNLKQTDGNVNALEALYSKYKDHLPESQFMKPLVSNAASMLESIKALIENKIQNVGMTTVIPPKTINELARFDSAINAINSLKAELLQKLQGIAPRRTDIIINDIKQVYKDLVILEFNQLDTRNGALSVYNSEKQKLATIDTTDENNHDGLLFWKNSRISELSKIKAESKGINKFLNTMGIDTFTIDLRDKPGEETKDIVVKYNTSQSEKNRECLSDGEKTALGFAYFLSKFENELNDTDKSEAIVVIDDPISSLDENRLYSTAHLITDSFSSVKQLIVFSHNFLFLKFFNAIYGCHPKHFFLDKDSLGVLPEELENFETTYFYMLKDIQKFNNGNIQYTEARKYLPNFIRRVLDTFLSFKFAILWSDKEKANNHVKSPDLGDTKRFLEKQNYKKELTEKLGKIIDITNKQSHGSVQNLTDNNSYISEDDLKQIATSTIEIMTELDAEHMTSINKFAKTDSMPQITPEEKSKIDAGILVKTQPDLVKVYQGNTNFSV
ncbi:MAG: AAA family ATPase [Muribaculaceae bacterium]|nr:AAA family ATPase [Muribaculaceae bacterium]